MIVLGLRHTSKTCCLAVSRLTKVASFLLGLMETRFVRRLTCMLRLSQIFQRESAYFFTPNMTGREVLYMMFAADRFPVWNNELYLYLDNKLFSCYYCYSCFKNIETEKCIN